MKKNFSRILVLVLCLSLLTGIVSAAENPFTDVKEGKFYYDAVLWAVQKEITTGTSATAFSPDNTCTRGQVVTFLWRAFGSPEPTKTTHPFTDVKETAFYYKAMLWAVENGITSGMTATTFVPGGNCTRGQVVTFLHRAVGEIAATKTTHPFTDVKETAFYYKAMLWAVENGITSGMSSTTFVPGGNCTRGQVVTFLYRTLKDGIPEEEKPTEPTECSHKYDSACDDDCNLCGEKRIPADHVYDNACDKDCNVCGLTRTPAAHVYDNTCDTTCNVCGAVREIEHTYDNGCDESCNVCGLTRETKHEYKQDIYGGYDDCIYCGNKPVSVSDITLDRDYVMVGDTFKASITVTGGEAPYTVTWYYIKEGNKQNKIEGASGLNPVITATEEMFNDLGQTKIYCSIVDAEGIPTSPMDAKMISRMGKLEVTLTESYAMWDVPESYPQPWDIGPAYATVVGGDGIFTYKWEYSRNKITWLEDTDGLADGLKVGPDGENNQSIGYCIATKEMVKEPVYVRVTVTDGSGQKVISNICVFYHVLEGGEVYKERARTLRAQPEGGDGTYEYEWYWCKNEFTGDLSKLHKIEGENGKEMTLTAEEIQTLKYSYCSTIVCKVTSGGKTVYVDASFSLIMNDK